MLWSVKRLEGFSVHATDGDIGSVRDFYFDDQQWVIRYLVVNTGAFFLGRQVLISPIAFQEVDLSTRKFNLALTREKVKNSPGIEVDKPVARQHEEEYFRYYGWHYYWGAYGTGMWGGAAIPSVLATSASTDSEYQQIGRGDQHLRSAREVTGYRIRGTDDDIGHIDDFIVDDANWALRYLVIDTRNWWPGRKVLVAPRWAERISWVEHRVYVDLPRKAIQSGPEWRTDKPIDRDYEARLHEHYGLPGYWHEEEGHSDEDVRTGRPRRT